MAPEKFDVLILGGGNAGIGVTGPARAAGLSVGHDRSRDLLGGTCPNRGCTPKKVLVAAGHALHEIERAKRPSHRRRQAEARLGGADRPREGHDQGHPGEPRPLMAERRVEVIRAMRSSPDRTPSRVGDRRIEAGHIVIATGSKPRAVPIPGAEHMITSDEVLSERALPRVVVFVGGGVIALEFGHVYARAGAKVTILEVLPRLLPAMDADAVAQAAGRKRADRHHGQDRRQVKRIETAPWPPARRSSSTMAPSTRLEADRVVNGAGRVANVDTLDLAAGQVEHDRRPHRARRSSALDLEPLRLCLRRRVADLAAALADRHL